MCIRDSRKIDLVTSEFKFKRFAAQPTFKSYTVYHEDLVAVERIKSELVLNRPIYIVESADVSISL